MSLEKLSIRALKTWLKSYQEKMGLKVIGLQRGLRSLWLYIRGYRRQWVASSIGPIHVWLGPRRGNGPTWVFIHGITSQALDWANMLLGIEKRLGQVMIIDAPGHGHSPLPHTGHLSSEDYFAGCLAAVEALTETKDLVLVGNSMGGHTAIRLALKLGAKVKGLGLISPAGMPSTEDELQAFREAFNVESRQHALAFVDKLYPRKAPLIPGRQLLGLCVEAHLNQKHFRLFIEKFKQVSTFSEGDLRKLQSPTLLIWGKLDRILPASGAEFFERNLPRGNTQILCPLSYTHTPFFDAPREVANDLINWAKHHPELLIHKKAG